MTSSVNTSFDHNPLRAENVVIFSPVFTYPKHPFLWNSSTFYDQLAFALPTSYSFEVHCTSSVQLRICPCKSPAAQLIQVNISLLEMFFLNCANQLSFNFADIT